MSLNFKSVREVFDYVRNFDLSSIKPLNEQLTQYHFDYFSIETLLDNISDNNILIIDARSEKEYEENSIPGAVNFPLLNNVERHFVGLIYKKYSPLAAIKLASEFADPKLDSLKDFLYDNEASNKNVYVHCWRGGGTSKYLSKMIFDLGNKNKILTGGIKSYRRKAIEFFSSDLKFNLIEINGLTGTGKTDLLNAVKNNLPVINLELAARHFSSLFGAIPYNIRNFLPVANQTAFENNLFGQIILQKESNFFLIESESKKIGDFYIPPNLYSKLLEAKCINLITNIEVRINRIINDYFGLDNKGLPNIVEIFIKKEKFFRKEISNKIYDELLGFLKSGRVYEFTEMMLLYYYDKKYKDKGKTPLLTINSDNIGSAKEELIKFINRKTPTIFKV